MVIRVIRWVSTVKPTSKPSRDTFQNHAVVCTVDLSTVAVNVSWGRVHTDNDVLIQCHWNCLTWQNQRYACMWNFNSRDIFPCHKEIICGCMRLQDCVKLWSHLNLVDFCIVLTCKTIFGNESSQKNPLSLNLIRNCQIHLMKISRININPKIKALTRHPIAWTNIILKFLYFKGSIHL